LSPRLKALLGATTIAAAVLTLTAIAATPLWPEIGGIPGLAFWAAVVAVSAAAPVRMPDGAYVSVTSAPIVAAAVLGGPIAAAVVALIGTLEWREVKGLLPGGRGGIPWYGTLFNHSSIAVPAIVASGVFGFLAPNGFAATPQILVAVVLVGAVHVLGNHILTAMAVGLRESRPVMSVFSAMFRNYGISFAGLAPLAWLMGAVYIVAGPIGVLPFALPLYTTRSAYRKVVEIRDMFTQTVKSLASAVDAKDPYTAGHSVRVQQIAKDLGRELNCSEAELEALEWGGLLHDIGKIGIPDAILLKQGELTRQERMAMNAHPVKGEEILRPVEKLAPELPIIRHHHEWYNGSGYPDRLMGEQIPRLARIMHVADAFEAMTAQRPYRMTPLSEDEALHELRRFTGVQFDPEVVAAFERVIVKRPGWSQPGEPRRPPPKPIPMLGQHEAGPQPA
jgi:putative nucleotidyltransferase with HDIG domain